LNPFRTQIRLNNVLDLWVAPQIHTDQIGQRFKSQVCPVYVAPEILSTGVYAAQPADMWALGILMFSLLMGRFPFHDPNPSALFKRIKARRFSCPVNDGISHNGKGKTGENKSTADPFASFQPAGCSTASSAKTPPTAPPPRRSSNPTGCEWRPSACRTALPLNHPQQNH
jgi:serine/threonine protein kinase